MKSPRFKLVARRFKRLWASRRRGPTPASALTFVLLTAGPLLAQSASPNNLLSQAVEMEKNKDWVGAERGYRQALLVAPDDPEILKKLGVVLQKELKYKESIETFHKILDRAPVYPGVNLLLGISYYDLNHFDEAEKALRRELTANPKDRQARYYLALALSASGQTVEALQPLQDLLTDNPRDAEVLYQLVLYYKAATQQMAQRLEKLSPDSQWSHALKAEIAAEAQQFGIAVTEYKEVLRQNPDFPGIHFALGQVYWQQKDSVHAQEQLRLALLEDPNQPLANYYVGDILTEAKSLAQAIPHLQIALAAYPELAQAYFLLGKCYAGTGESQRAIETLSKTLELDPSYKEAHFQLYELYSRLGDKVKSQEHLQTFEKLTREGQLRDKERLEELSQKQKDDEGKQ